jgi:methylmalonyl-CoA mutase cobalamin-binding subunit
MNDVDLKIPPRSLETELVELIDRMADVEQILMAAQSGDIDPDQLQKFLAMGNQQVYQARHRLAELARRFKTDLPFPAAA